MNNIHRKSKIYLIIKKWDITLNMKEKKIFLKVRKIILG